MTAIFFFDFFFLCRSSLITLEVFNFIFHFFRNSLFHHHQFIANFTVENLFLIKHTWLLYTPYKKLSLFMIIEIWWNILKSYESFQRPPTFLSCFILNDVFKLLYKKLNWWSLFHFDYNKNISCFSHMMIWLIMIQKVR
jgi:hypothetical protein